MCIKHNTERMGVPDCSKIVMKRCGASDGITILPLTLTDDDTKCEHCRSRSDCKECAV